MMRQVTLFEAEALAAAPSLPRQCSVAVCDGRPVGRGLCRKHYLRWWKGKEVEDFRDRVYSENMRNGTFLIPLTHGSVALVSPEDYERVRQIRWNKNSHGYAVTSGTGPSKRFLTMHGFVLGGIRFIDHIDGDKLNNRRDNLRKASPLQNSWNRGKSRTGKSNYKGVSWHKRGKKWTAFIRHNRIHHYLGLFRSERDAAIAYNNAASVLHGEFARLNDV